MAARRASNRVNLNTASRARLARLEAVGERGAARILDERDRRGGFRSMAEVEAIKGLPPEALRYLREHARV